VRLEKKKKPAVTVRVLWWSL